MIVYMGNSNLVCDLSLVADSLLQEGYSYEEVVLEIIQNCAMNGVHVYKYDVEMMVRG